MKDLKIALRKPSSLKDYENNPRFNDHAVDAVVESIREFGFRNPILIVNPLGFWTGGLDVDAGATNRKLGSDMGGSVTGGGLHGKDLSKADVSVNIYAWLKAQAIGRPVELFCAIGDEKIDGRPYQEIMQIAKNYIRKIGGFEKFAEWGLLRPDGPAMAELLRDLP